LVLRQASCLSYNANVELVVREVHGYLYGLGTKVTIGIFLILRVELP
jgi:hypothetical protein